MTMNAEWKPGDPIGYIREEAPKINLPSINGESYEALVPDTLDLAERARLGLKHFTEIIHEDYDYEMPYSCTFNESNPPVMNLHLNGLATCQPKAIEAMCFARLMSGSDLNLEREAKMMEMSVSLLGEDGLQWVPGSSDKPWLKIPEPFAAVHAQGRMLRAMIAWYEYTGDHAWKERIDRLVDGMDRYLVVHKEDYAYVPVYGFYEGEYLRSCYTRKGWKDTVEPTNEKFGEEGSLFNQQGHLPGGLANWYVLTGNEQALRLSGELVRFYTKPKFWADWERGEYPGVVGAEHAHWQGHFHGHINTLRAILEYAIAVDDSRLKHFVRDGYEWARQQGFRRIGYVGDNQGCACGRLIGLAVKLSYTGVGDYWEDVDQYVRNHGIEMQITPEDVDYLRKLSDDKPAPPDRPGVTTDSVIERSIGGFAGRIDKSTVWLCCSPHGNMGLFYAWDGIVRFQDGTGWINLLLNRASPWLDIDSCLPYEGKVVIKNKTAREIFARIPLWVDRKAVRCKLGDKDLPNVWFGNYIRYDGLRPKDILTIQFPMVENTEKWTVPKLDERLPGPDLQIHTCRFRGNTLVELTPPLAPLSPLYQRRPEKYKATEAPTKKTTRYVSPTVLRW